MSFELKSMLTRLYLSARYTFLFYGYNSMNLKLILLNFQGKEMVRLLTPNIVGAEMSFMTKVPYAVESETSHTTDASSTAGAGSYYIVFNSLAVTLTVLQLIYCAGTLELTFGEELLYLGRVIKVCK